MTFNITSRPNPHHLAHPKYRADIDGLRAIAVLSVVAFHAFPNWVKGGFIGVDIFFVISGFLISTIIFENLASHSFSFATFYSRRVRRIFPALLTVLFSSLMFGWFALLADEYKQLGKHVSAGAGFVSNLILWNESGYFDNAAEMKPLLHLWSLGIEEQFYILWPPLLWLAWKFRLNFLLLTIAIAAISFALNIRHTGTDAIASFYSPQTRFWELLTGSCLAYLSLIRRSPPPQSNTGTGDLRSIAGAVLLVVGIFLITKERAFPGWWGLFPVFGATLIISAGSQALVNRIILSHPLLVWFGLISFPLYLWHWPLLSFANILEGRLPSREIRAAAVVASILLAWLTYKFIERPVRFGKPARKTIALVLLMLTVGVTGYYCYQRDGLESRIEKGLSEKIEAITDRNLRNFHFNEQVDRVSHNCKTMIGKDNDGLYCQLPAPAPRILIVGDSHAISFAYSQVLMENPAVAVVAAHSCLPLVNFATADKNENLEIREPICRKAMAAAIRIAENLPSIEYVVLIGRGGYEFNIKEVDRHRNLTGPQSFVMGYLETISAFQKLGKKVIFAVDVPDIGTSPKNCVDTRRIRLTAQPAGDCTIGLEEVRTKQSQYRSLIQEIAAKSSGVQFFDPTDVFCDGKTCYGIRGDEVYYFDSHHLARLGSEMVFKRLARFISHGSTDSGQAGSKPVK
ncbi:MAG: acyltransferase family protein [Rhodocyclaceae bacterium]|nr:acyltransferase family protein [Rhodocyclaceae bacterium]